MKCQWFVAKAACVVVIGAVGCGPKPTVTVAVENPPAFGSTAAYKDVGSFLDGKWGLKYVTDPELARQAGVTRWEPDSDTIGAVVTFKKDGKLTTRIRSFGYRIGGSWKTTDRGLELSFETMDGKPIKEVFADAQAAEDRGSIVGAKQRMRFSEIGGLLSGMKEWELSPDKKSLRGLYRDSRGISYPILVRVKVVEK